MPSLKQSNWLLGFGVVVAILIIAFSLWYKTNPNKDQDAVINKSVTENGQTIPKVKLLDFRSVGNLLKALN